MSFTFFYTRVNIYSYLIFISIPVNSLIIIIIIIILAFFSPHFGTALFTSVDGAVVTKTVILILSGDGLVIGIDSWIFSGRELNRKPDALL